MFIRFRFNLALALKPISCCILKKHLRSETSQMSQPVSRVRRKDTGNNVRMVWISASCKAWFLLISDASVRENNTKRRAPQ